MLFCCERDATIDAAFKESVCDGVWAYTFMMHKSSYQPSSTTYVESATATVVLMMVMPARIKALILVMGT